MVSGSKCCCVLHKPFSACVNSPKVSRPAAGCSLINTQIHSSTARRAGIIEGTMCPS